MKLIKNDIRQKSKKQISLEIKRLKNYVKKKFPEGWDKIDTEAEYDSTLSYGYNKEHLTEIINKNLPLKDILNNLATKNITHISIMILKHKVVLFFKCFFLSKAT